MNAKKNKEPSKKGKHRKDKQHIEKIREGMGIGLQLESSIFEMLNLYWAEVILNGNDVYKNMSFRGDYSHLSKEISQPPMDMNLIGYHVEIKSKRASPYLTKKERIANNWTCFDEYIAQPPGWAELDFKHLEKIPNFSNFTKELDKKAKATEKTQTGFFIVGTYSKSTSEMVGKCKQIHYPLSSFNCKNFIRCYDGFVIGTMKADGKGKPYWLPSLIRLTSNQFLSFFPICFMPYQIRFDKRCRLRLKNLCSEINDWCSEFFRLYDDYTYLFDDGSVDFTQADEQLLGKRFNDFLFGNYSHLVSSLNGENLLEIGCSQESSTKSNSIIGCSILSSWHIFFKQGYAGEKSIRFILGLCDDPLFTKNTYLFNVLELTPEHISSIHLKRPTILFTNVKYTKEDLLEKYLVERENWVFHKFTAKKGYEYLEDVFSHFTVLIESLEAKYADYTLEAY